MRWRRDDRPAPDDRRDHDDDADNWLSEFRGQSIRPDALTAADRDAGGRRATQVGSRPGPGEHADVQPGREARTPGGPYQETERGARQPAPRPGQPRVNLERDVGPWAGVQREPEPDSDARGRWTAWRAEPAGGPAASEAGGRRDRQPADPDTDRFGWLERERERTARDDRRRAQPAADPGSHTGDRRSAGAGRADRPAGRRDPRSDDGQGAFPARADWRRSGPDTYGSQGHDGYRPGPLSQPGRDDGRDRGPLGNGATGPARLPAPPSTGARSPEQAPRRELPGAWSDAGPGLTSSARPGSPGSPPPGGLRPDQHGRPAGPGRGGASTWPDADGRSAHGRRPDAPPQPAHSPGLRPDSDPGARLDAGSWLAPPGRAPRPGPAFAAEPPQPSAAQRAQSPASDRVLPPAAQRPLPPAAERVLPPDRPRQAGAERRALPAPPQSRPAQSQLPESQLAPAGAAQPALPPPSEAPPAESARDARPQLTANLSLADLGRVREALQLLSEEPGPPSGRAAARDDTTSPPALSTQAGDDEDTTPLPVILPGAAAVPRPDVLETARGPFEPARAAPSTTVAERAPVDARVPPPAPAAVSAPDGAALLAPDESAVPVEAEPAEPDDTLPPAAAEKLDQIKDLLITAEAIGEVNLDRHFDRVSQRQRELIREFFDRAMPGREPEA